MSGAPRRLGRGAARRPRIVLAAADGAENQDIAATLGLAGGTLRTWRRRFADQRLPGLAHERPGRGRPLTKRKHRARMIIGVTLHTIPKNATHWSQCSLAEHLGNDKPMVQRVWIQRKGQPHHVRTFKRSRAPRLVEKLIDVVGLYLRPPEHALALWADEEC